MTEPIQFTARLDPDLHRELGEVANNRDLSLNRALGQAVKAYLRDNHQTREQLEVPDGDGNPPLQIHRRHNNGEGVWTCDVEVEQHLVPYLEVCEIPAGHPGGFENETSYTIGLDNRFGTSAMTYEDLWKQVWFWSQAMAVAAGYTSHGPNSHRMNRYGPSEPLATNVDEGWSVMEQSGCLGKGYEVTMTFNLPNMVDGDQWAYDIRDHMRRLVHDLGVRDVVTRIIALGGLEADRRECSPMSAGRLEEPAPAVS